MKEKDDAFPEAIKEVAHKFNNRSSDIEIFKTISGELKGKMGTAKGNMAVVTSSGETRDKFMDYFETETTIAEKQVTQVEKNKEQIYMTHEKTCELFGLKLTDEICEKSETFLKIFSDFFENCVKALPVEEKKRGGGRAPTGKTDKAAGAAAPM